ncbi:MAG: hypothetical protein KF760_03775 [Candidatus Eremiobacteraeota bacterium]|nr:hypothetical protein [Candidatus Eremiobacteraeota bacterium]MCW5872663.1 hypothetical protein [Candidatus Eremiobacteraeota bacterium]
MQGFRPEAVARALKKPAPEPPQPPSWFTWENGLKLVALGTKVGAAYYKHQQYWWSREEKVLAAARDHHGWLTEARMLEALEYRHKEVARVSSSLCDRGLCRQLVSRQGQPIYLFDAFLPPVRFCDYCDQERPAGPLVSCRCCGAP